MIRDFGHGKERMNCHKIGLEGLRLGRTVIGQMDEPSRYHIRQRMEGVDHRIQQASIALENE